MSGSAPAKGGSLYEADVYGALVAWGAALLHEPRPAPAFSTIEDLLPHATRLSHHDATVLRTLPLLLARYGDGLALERLQQAAARENQEAEIGMLLALTGLLIRSKKLQQAATRFEHARKPTPELFFHASQSEREYRVAQLRTPTVVREWGFLMNMPEDVFRTLLEKYRAHDLQGIEDIHRASPLELETLLSRFHETYVTGRREDFQLSLLLLVERLFGKAAADALEERL